MSRETRYELRGSLATNVIREADDQKEGSSFFSPPLLSFLPLNRISPLDLDPGNVSPAEKPTFFPFFFFFFLFIDCPTPVLPGVFSSIR